METLTELITRVLASRGETVTAFAARIGVNRLTVSRWSQSLPAPNTLRRVADDLNVPYSHVLRAAMASSGYATSPADLLAGQQVHVVTCIGDSDPEDGLPPVLFAGTERADAYIRAMDAVDVDCEYSQAVAVIDSAEIPVTFEIFTTVWASRADQIRQYTTRTRCTPARLLDREVTDVEATALAESGDVFLLQADSLNAEAGRAAIISALNILRHQARLYPAGLDPRPAVEDWARYVEYAKDKYSDPPPNTGNVAPAISAVPPDFAQFRRRGDQSTPEQKAVWPQTHRFVVPLGGSS